MPNQKYFIDQLDNQLRVLTVPDSNFSYTLFSLFGKIGRRSERDDEIGAAHFLEHLFFDGTSKRPNAYEINKFIEDNGGAKNGITTTETVEYFVKILPHKSDIGCEFLSDIFFNSLLKDEDIKKERNVIRQEVAMRKDNPNDFLTRLRRSTLYPNQAVGRTIFDEEPNLDKIDVNLLKRYMNRVYNSSNFILCVSGNITREESIGLANKYFGSLKTGDRVTFSPPQIERGQTIKSNLGDYKQAKLSISFKGYPSHTKESLTLHIINIVLGGGFSSRLYNKLRNQLHLVYNISCSHDSFSDGGHNIIQTHSKEENIQQTANEIFSEIKKLLKDGVNKDELQKAKNILTSRFLFGLDTPSSKMEFYGDQLLLKNDIKDMNYHLDVINNSTPDSLLEVAQEVFSDKPKINILSQNTESIEVNF